MTTEVDFLYKKESISIGFVCYAYKPISPRAKKIKLYYQGGGWAWFGSINPIQLIPWLTIHRGINIELIIIPEAEYQPSETAGAEITITETNPSDPPDFLYINRNGSFWYKAVSIRAREKTEWILDGETGWAPIGCIQPNTFTETISECCGFAPKLVEVYEVGQRSPGSDPDGALVPLPPKLLPPPHRYTILGYTPNRFGEH